jgi:hypothetical protein
MGYGGGKKTSRVFAKTSRVFAQTSRVFEREIGDGGWGREKIFARNSALFSPQKHHFGK